MYKILKWIQTFLKVIFLKINVFGGMSADF